MLEMSFETIFRTKEGSELMSNRDNDRNANQNPRSGNSNPGQQNPKQQSQQQPGQKPGQGGKQQDAGMGDVNRNLSQGSTSSPRR